MQKGTRRAQGRAAGPGDSMDEKLKKELILPRHIGIIMDGNGRWAKIRGLERTEGHKVGAEVFRRICNYGVELGIEAMTFYAFSTENWKRPEKEVNAIMNLFRDFLEEAQERENENEEKGFRIRFIGDRSALPGDIIELFNQCERNSEGRNRMTVNLAVNYGGRAEIVHAASVLAEKAAAGEISPASITEEMFAENLYTAGVPDPDVIIRPGGESRISNFLVWQCAYSEFVFTETLWPDFTEEKLDEAIIDFCKRNRRYGGI